MSTSRQFIVNARMRKAFAKAGKEWNKHLEAHRHMLEGDSFTVEPKEKKTPKKKKKTPKVEKTPKVDLMAILVRDWMNRAIIRAKFLKELKDTLEREFSKKIKPKRFTGGLVQFISTHPSTDHCTTPGKFDKFLKKAFETKRRRK